MDFTTLSGHGYLLVGGIILIGGGLVILSLIFNLRVAHSVRHDQRHREKLLEYYRNTLSQLGVILIGIGISLFIFFFQQNYQDSRRRETEFQQIHAKMALRIARGAAIVGSLGEFDAILDKSGPYVEPSGGGTTPATSDSEIAEQARQLLLVERDVDLQAFQIMNMSRDFETSSIVNDLNPSLWFNIVGDESDVQYAITQLDLDYADLKEAIGSEAIGVAMADPDAQSKIRNEVQDILYDADLLRQRSRRLLARACWLLSKGANLAAVVPVEQLEREYASHKEWLEAVEPFLTVIASGNRNCFQLMRYSEKT